MGTITVSVATTPVTGSKTYTISDADMQNVINWATAQFSFGSTPLPPAQALLAWARWLMDQTIVAEHGPRKTQAAQQAIAGVPPISIS
jgi:hypothetical protein